MAFSLSGCCCFFFWCAPRPRCRTLFTKPLSLFLSQPRRAALFWDQDRQTDRPTDRQTGLGGDVFRAPPPSAPTRPLPPVSTSQQQQEEEGKEVSNSPRRSDSSGRPVCPVCGVCACVWRREGGRDASNRNLSVRQSCSCQQFPPHSSLLGSLCLPPSLPLCLPLARSSLSLAADKPPTSGGS